MSPFNFDVFRQKVASFGLMDLSYRISNVIGSGSFSTVKLVTNRITNKQFACKIVPRALIRRYDMEKMFFDSVRTLKSLKHKHIAQFVDFFADEENNYLVFEYCSEGSLLRKINSEGMLRESDSRKIIYQVSLALSYLHSRNIIHRDIKPDNIMIDENGDVKLIDFDFCSEVLGEELRETSCGTPSYSSPQVISGAPYDGKKNDVWSLGVVLYAMVSGRLPWYQSRNLVKFYERILTEPLIIPSYLTKNCSNLIREMLEVNEDKRIDINGVLRSPFLSQVYSEVSHNGINTAVARQPSSLFSNRMKQDLLFLKEPRKPRRKSFFIDMVPTPPYAVKQ